MTGDVKVVCVGESLRQGDQHVQGARGKERGPQNETGDAVTAAGRDSLVLS